MSKLLYSFIFLVLISTSLQAEIDYGGSGGGGGSASTTYFDDISLKFGTDGDVDFSFDTNTSGDQLFVTRFLESNGSDQIPVWLMGDASLTDAVISTTWDNVTEPTKVIYNDAGTAYSAVTSNSFKFSSGNFGILDNGDSTIIRLLASTGVVINNSQSGTRDFQVRTGTNLNAIFSDSSADAVGFGYATPTAGAHFGWRRADVVTTLTIADDAAGTSPAGTVTPATNYNEITCNDTNGCTAALSETGAVEGQDITIVSTTTNAVTITDTAGVSEMSGNFTLSQYDSISFIYDGTQWVETARSNNT